MDEHRIRLRAAWVLDPGPDPGEGRPRRVDLPIAWHEDAGPRARLRRGFGRPRLDPDRESARLELAEVPGLLAVRINGADAGPIGGAGPLSVPLPDPLPARNVVELEVDLAGLGPAARARAWGQVAVVVGPRTG
jgi:hypothetical protein